MTQSANADPQIIGREVAREQGLKRYFTGKPCSRGHVGEWHVSGGVCVECRLEQGRKHRADNPEKIREEKRKAYAANSEKIREEKRKARAADPEKHRKQDRKNRAAPLGQLRGACLHTGEKLELGKLNHSRLKLLGYGPAEYIARLVSTLPNGMTFDEARAAGYQVDHIVPLAVINEACPMDKAGRKRAFQMAQDLDNLQMLPGAENKIKNARFDTEEQRRLFDVLCSRYLE